VKVAIICSSAEPGRDGVGDYSVRLGSALAAAGHRAFVVAERDPAVTAAAPVNTEREGVPVLRLPASLPDRQRGRALADALDRFAPDWVIVQFVCWGFADRGVLDPPLSALVAALSGRRIAIYCHELWLGLERGASLRHRWWGRSQRNSILRFFSQLQPALVLTSNLAYARVLERFGWSARVVPLFSNIPFRAEGRAKFLALFEQSSDVFMVAVFGSVYPEWQPQAALQWIIAEARRRNRRVLLVIAGRPSPRGEALVERLTRELDYSATILVLGEIPPDVVSGLLQEADIGLPSSDWLLLDKSGVAAAMTAHGLPMLVVRNGVSFRDLPALSVTHAPSVFRFDTHSPPDFDRLASARTRPLDTLAEITVQLVGVMKEHSGCHIPTVPSGVPLRESWHESSDHST
jgi:glycosyltransferase involved in cell wall biosynthesis